MSGATVTSSALLDIRLTALRNGYTPLPIPAGQKGPMLTGWRRVAPDTATVRLWSAERPVDTNTGLLCGEVIAVDIDVLDPAVSADLEF